MAGAGYKLFNTGDVLTAAQVNTYLMEQTVMVFANAAARTTALSGVVSEGMISYLKDTNAVEVYDGSNWVSSDDPNAIQNTIVDAKGDLIAASAADTPARLAVGNNGETLVADSSATTGLRWQGNFAAGKNKIINGNFDIWQRGTSSAAIASGSYLADRWRTILVGTSINATYSRDTSVPNGASFYSAKLQQLTNNATSVGEFGLHQIFEVANVLGFAGKTVSVSFWYRSNKTGSHYARLYTVNATGGADVTTAFTVSSANTWEYKTLTFASYASVTAFTGALTDNGGALQIGLNLYPTSAITVTANDYFQISQVQVEAGNVATAFQTATGTLAGELAACQRYYEKSYAVGTAPGTTTTVGLIAVPVTSTANGGYYTRIYFSETKRTTATVTVYGYSGTAGTVSTDSNGADQAANSGSVKYAGETGFAPYNNSGGTVTTSGATVFHWVASAEL